MKKIVLLLSLFSFLIITPFAYAQSSPGQKNVTLARGETSNQDYFAFGDVVTIDGTVNGDVYAAGGQININGKVSGDVLIAGGNVTLSGEVTQDVRVAGGQVTISGKVGQNITVLAGNISLTSSAQVGGSLVGVGGSFTIDSLISGNIKIASGDVLVSSKVGGEANIAATNINLTAKASVGGNLNYWSDNSASIDSGVKITGKINKSLPPNKDVVNSGSLKAFFAKVAFFSHLASFIILLLLGLVLIHVFPIFSDLVAVTISKRPLAVTLIGLVALLVTPIIAAILFATLLGIPLSLILIATYLIAIYLTRIFAIFWIGKFILARLNQKTRPTLVLVVGLIIYTLVTLLPLVGGPVSFAIAVTSLGAYLLTVYNSYFIARKKSVI